MEAHTVNTLFVGRDEGFTKEGADAARLTRRAVPDAVLSVKVEADLESAWTMIKEGKKRDAVTLLVVNLDSLFNPNRDKTEISKFLDRIASRSAQKWWVVGYSSTMRERNQAIKMLKEENETEFLTKGKASEIISKPLSARVLHGLHMKAMEVQKI